MQLSSIYFFHFDSNGQMHSQDMKVGLGIIIDIFLVDEFYN